MLLLSEQRDQWFKKNTQNVFKSHRFSSIIVNNGKILFFNQQGVTTS